MPHTKHRPTSISLSFVSLHLFVSFHLSGLFAGLHGSYRGALLCHVRLDLAPVHPTRCRWMIKIIKLLWDVIANAKLLGFERLRLEGRELSRKFL